MHEEDQGHDENRRIQYVILIVALAKVVTLLVERSKHDFFVKGIPCSHPLHSVWTGERSLVGKSETLQFERDRLPLELRRDTTYLCRVQPCEAKLSERKWALLPILTKA